MSDGQRMTPAEYERYKAAHAAESEPAQRMTPEEAAAYKQAHSSFNIPITDPAVAMGRALSPESLKEMAGGAKNSLKRTGLGLKQVGAYVFGNDDSRAAVNKEIADLEAEQAASGPAGSVGDFVGNAAQFAVPGSIASKVAKVIPEGAKAIQGVTGGAGSIKRGTATSGAYEAAQPVQPSDLSNEDLFVKKGLNVAKGVATAVPSAAVSKGLTREDPWLRVDPERKAITKEAERLGLELTPAQKTQDRTLQQWEEGLLAKPGSGKLIAEVRGKQKAVLNEKAAKALGVDAAAPNEATLQLARENAAKLYEPMAGIKSLPPDQELFDTLKGVMATQKATVAGSPDVARAAKRLMNGLPNMTGQRFLQELQSIRNLGYKATKDGLPDTANQFHSLSDAMEDFAERKVAEMAGRGEVAPDAVRQMVQGRAEYAKLHAIEKAVEPVTGNVSPEKYLNQEFRRRPASKGKGTSPVEAGLADVGATARVMLQTKPYIGSSGTAERMGGQEMVNLASGNWKNALPYGKNYLLAKYYLNYGDKPGYLAKHLSPENNMMVRRMIPQEILAAEETAQR